MVWEDIYPAALRRYSTPLRVPFRGAQKLYGAMDFHIQSTHFSLFSGSEFIGGGCSEPTCHDAKDHTVLRIKYRVLSM